MAEVPWWCCGGAPDGCEMTFAQCQDQVRMEEERAETLAAADLDPRWPA